MLAPTIRNDRIRSNIQHEREEKMSVSRVITLLLLVSGLAGEIFTVNYLLSQEQPSTAAPAQAQAITQLTHDVSGALRPSWSPDNRSIAYESSRDGTSHIYTMDASGSNQRPLTFGERNDRHASWTQDGKSILFDSSDDIHQDIWIVNVEKGAPRHLIHIDGLADYASMSPNGQRIAFYVYRDMTLNIWSARADGSDAKPLTHDLADARREEPTIAWHSPSWSADSQWLTYTGGDGRSIWIMRADGSDAREIINDGETNHFPWFLRDGRLAFITEYVPPTYGAAWTNLWTYDLATQQRTLVQEFMSMQEPVAWNADLSKLLFASPRNGKFDICAIDLDASDGLTELQGGLASVSGGAWQ
jgi:Tol biopolymer transport system component